MSISETSSSPSGDKKPRRGGSSSGGMGGGGGHFFGRRKTCLSAAKARPRSTIKTYVFLAGLSRSAAKLFPHASQRRTTKSNAS